jgi:addiction module HigA family antidote
MFIRDDVPHPGTRIKAEVIPTGMSVTKAAQLMGVGRPALSNLLNGNTALSVEMAARLETAFNYAREELLEMQAKYDAAQAKKKDPPTDTRAYVPPFLRITANQIEEWVDHNIAARMRFAVLLRTLVHSTGRSLTKVDFPGNDDAERPGWDGFVEAGEGTPWIPVGTSGWEFGTSEDPKTKAEGDFNKSVKAFQETGGAEMTFVFVTPRRWGGKSAWVAAKKAKGLWKDVRVYDASDIEQWLEQSLPAQTWFANETRGPSQHVRSLDKCWMDWANVSTPPLNGTLFSSAIEATKRVMLSRLSKPVEGPIRIGADSTEEALAFLSQLLSECGGADLASYRDRVLVFDKPGVLPRLVAGAQTFIAVAFTREVERELAPHAKSMHSIVIYPRNVARTPPEIVLEPATQDTFNKSLEEMGKDRDEILRLENASGRSLTVLRRQVSSVDAVRVPEWAEDRRTAASLVPFFFVGAWNSQNEADAEGLSLLAGERSYTELEAECQTLTQLNDAPIWSVGHYRGVISKIDLLYAIQGVITPDDLRRYFSMARMVLGEDDPTLDLQEGQRWAASIYGKTREFSREFREGISETLVLLAVHGRKLFNHRLGVDPEIEAAFLVRDLLTPLTTRVLEANDRDLPTYAEAAPDEFLSILERDLKTETPAVLGLLRPAAHVFGHPSRTGLLWALEGLSWNPETLGRAASILARLSQVEISDNWVNKPAHSLGAIFRAWMPQTAANLETRVDLMRKLAQNLPDVAWKICVAEFSTHDQLGDYSHKPRWRPDGYGFGEPLPTWKPVLDFNREMVKMALAWPDYSLKMLCDLVQRLQNLNDDDQARVWALIEGWARTKADDAGKAELREKIRVTTLSRRATLRAKKDKVASVATAGKAAYEALEPTDLLNKHAWLFRDGWVEESADEVEDLESIDFHKQEVRVQELRINALNEIFEYRGLTGILQLSEKGRAAWTIGFLMASSVLTECSLPEFLQLALAPIRAGKERTHSNKTLISGALRGLADNDKREAVLKSVLADLAEIDKVKLLILAPYRKSTWTLVTALGEGVLAKYWDEVVPDWIQGSDVENIEGAESLLSAGRPRAAFSCVRLGLRTLDPELLFRLTSQMAKDSKEQPGQYQLEQYWIEEAFKYLNEDSAVTLDQKAALEFAYIDVLAHAGGYGIPNLERYIEIHPEFFVQAVVWVYKRKDGATDPVEFRTPHERFKSMAERGYRLLETLRRIPGYNDLGELEAARLAEWIATVRRASTELSRADIADVCIGKLLSCAPIGEDGVWPCEPVRDTMEKAQSESLMRGCHTGVYNSRGVHSRREGGDQERELADKYRKWGHALQVSHPFVASKLLLALAKTYDHEADQEDMEAGIRRRLH